MLLDGFKLLGGEVVDVVPDAERQVVQASHLGRASFRWGSSIGRRRGFCGGFDSTVLLGSVLDAVDDGGQALSTRKIRQNPDKDNLASLTYGIDVIDGGTSPGSATKTPRPSKAMRFGLSALNEPTTIYILKCLDTLAVGAIPLVSIEKPPYEARLGSSHRLAFGWARDLRSRGNRKSQHFIRHYTKIRSEMQILHEKH